MVRLVKLLQRVIKMKLFKLGAGFLTAALMGCASQQAAPPNETEKPSEPPSARNCEQLDGVAKKLCYRQEFPLKRS